MANTTFRLFQRMPTGVSRLCFGTSSSKLTKTLEVQEKTSKFLRPEICMTKPQQQNITGSGRVTSTSTQGVGGFVPIGQILKGKAAKILMSFTCKKCSTRVVKFISKMAYKHGAVIIKCGTCEHDHLIADNLGWFAELNGEDSTRTFEEILEQKEESVSYSLTDNNATEVLARKEQMPKVSV